MSVCEVVAVSIGSPCSSRLTPLSAPDIMRQETGEGLVTGKYVAVVGTLGVITRQGTGMRQLFPLELWFHFHHERRQPPAGVLCAANPNKFLEFQFDAVL